MGSKKRKHVAEDRDEWAGSDKDALVAPKRQRVSRRSSARVSSGIDSVEAQGPIEHKMESTGTGSHGSDDAQ